MDGNLLRETGCASEARLKKASATFLERRALLRWISWVGVCAMSLPIGAPVSLAQHHQNAGFQVPHGGEGALIFAAATLKPALDEVIGAYQAEGGAKSSVAYGPAPTLAKNIADGAPADVFFSADVLWMDYLAKRKLIRDETRIDVVRDEIVLVQGESRGEIQAIRVGPSFPIIDVVGSGPIAICNPESHPAGRYARLRLQESNLWDAIASKIAIVENPQVAALMVARGDATAAVVFATDMRGLGGVRIAGVFSDQTDSPIVFPAAVTANAPHPENARHLLEYLLSPTARKIFEQFGYH
jgi:molybdate transport system substrate-binding protein